MSELTVATRGPFPVTGLITTSECELDYHQLMEGTGDKTPTNLVAKFRNQDEKMVPVNAHSWLIRIVIERVYRASFSTSL
jgi:hypothetical protein